MPADAPTTRDVTRALFAFVETLAGTTFRTKIGVGLSSGSQVLSAINFGRSRIGGQTFISGSNTDESDPALPRIFDGFVPTGLPVDVPNTELDPVDPISAPTFFLIGRFDDRYQAPIHQAYALLQKGVAIEDWVWIYEWKGVPHGTRDNTYQATPPNGGPDGDRFGCAVSAALRNMRAYLLHGEPPPVSRIAGRLVSGAPLPSLEKATPMTRS
jgi:hypothetical protein